MFTKKLLDIPSEPRLWVKLRNAQTKGFQGSRLEEIQKYQSGVVWKDADSRKRLYKTEHPYRWALSRNWYLIFAYALLMLASGYFVFWYLPSMPIFGILVAAGFLIVWIINEEKITAETHGEEWRRRPFDHFECDNDIKVILQNILCDVGVRIHNQGVIVEEEYHPDSAWRFLIVSDPKDPDVGEYYIHSFQVPFVEQAPPS